MSLGFATVHLVRYIKLFTKVVVSFSLLPAEQGNYIFMFHIRGQQTFSVKSHIIHMLGFSTKWQNRATILHESLIAFLYFSLKYVKTILTYGLYKGRWQSRFGLWAGICQSCSVSLSILDIIRCLTLANLRGLQRVGHDWATELNWTEPQGYKVMAQHGFNLHYPDY